MNDKRNVIESVQNTQLTKKKLINLINESFPDEEVGIYGQIAHVITTKMTDGTIMQSVSFGKILSV